MLKSLAIRNPTPIVASDNVLDVLKEWHTVLENQVKDNDISESTSKTYIKGMDKFLTWCDLVQLQDIDNKAIMQWKASLKGCKPNSINAWLAGVRAFFGWAYVNHRIAYNPTEGIKGAKRKDTTKRHRKDMLSNQEVRNLLSAIDTSKPEGIRDLAWLSLMLFTGCRTIEIQRAKLSDLRSIGDLLVLDVTGKGHFEADDIVIISSPELKANLTNWLAIRGNKPGALFWSFSKRSMHKELSLQAIRAIWLTYKKDAGIFGNKTVHSLRHTAITNAIKHGATPMQAQQMARHKSLDTTLIYIHELDRMTNPAEGFISYDD